MSEKEKTEEKDEKKEERYPLDTDKEPIVTQHQVEAAGKPLKYEVTTGMMPLTSPTGEVEAGIFYMAYAKKGVRDRSKRPLMFSFNGGPGSSSVWLHLGAIGPKRVAMLEDGSQPPPPYKLVDNPHTWLQDTDLVFIDPVGTGYSRPATKELGEKFWGLKGDIESVGDFIRMYLTRFERWTSPLFLVGESYGTTRAAGLSGHLIEKGIAFNGIILVSSVLNFVASRFAKGNDLPYVLFLPTYTATAWFHRKLAKELQKDLKAALREVEEWAAGEYAQQLSRGDKLSARERQEVVRKLARYTGLEPRYIENSDLRVEIHHFCKELLRDEKRTVGRLDSRFKGIDASGVSETPDFDPSLAAIRPPYTAMFNDYVRAQLGYKTDAPYHILGGGIDKPWDWGSAAEGPADTSDALRAAFTKNPYMHLFIASGYFDLATPYFATKFTLSHMGLDASFRGNVMTGEYEAGHMMYIHERSLRKLKADIAAFIKKAVRK
jgi:carboxypeptidase C (cathepsin A)